MKKYIHKLLVLVLSLSLLTPSGMTEAHSGRTDSSGGHHDYRNASGLGSYHYHHGYGPHLHSNGNCPYETTHTSSAKSSSSRSINKKYQKKLNRMGYSCGTPDGVLGRKSKNAIRKFQKKYKLAVTGNLNKKTKKKINKVYRTSY